MTAASLRATDQDAAYISGNEGTVLRAYKDSGGVITIGDGFTMGSKVFASYWKQKYGRALRMGDTITKAESRKLFRALLDEEYGPAVNSKIGTKVQHEFCAALDTAYNCGKGSLTWQWAKALASRAVTTAAKLLLTTAVTAGGKTLVGLKNRRARTSQLMLTGDYQGLTISTASESIREDAVKEYQQQLKQLGYYSGTVDGIRGPLTKGAVENFQRANGLLVDGKVGPATRAALQRALGAKTRNQTAAGGAAGTGAAGAANEGAGNPLKDILPLDSPLTLLLIAAGVVVVIYLAHLAWSHRGLITGLRTPA